MSSLKFKAKNKNDTLLDQLCSNLMDKYLTTNITLTVSGEGGDPDQKFEGIIVLCRFPTEEKPSTSQG